MNYMFEIGFLGTRAPFFMDLVTIIVALLPFLILSAISLARAKKYKLHETTQITLFIVSAIIFTYFEIGVRVGGGFKTFMEGSEVSHNYAFIILVLHIIIATVTLFIWILTLFKAKKNFNKKMHHKMAKITFIGIVLTSLSGIWVYLLLFVY